MGKRLEAELELRQLRQQIERMRAAESRDLAAAERDVTRRVLDSIAAGVMQVAPDGRILYANSHAQQLLATRGFPEFGDTLRPFEHVAVWQDGTECCYEDFPSIKCLRTGEPQPPTTIGIRVSEREVVWATITTVPLVDPASGRIESAITTFLDVSQPKRIEDSWRASEDRYRLLVDNAPDAIVVHRDEKIVFINQAGVKMWGGKSAQDMVGRDILSFVHPRDRQTSRRRLAQAMAGGVPPLVDQLHVRLDGRVVHVEATGTPCIYDGQPSIQAILRDVTEKKLAEDELRRQRKMVEEMLRSGNAELEQRVQARTEELSTKNAELEREIFERRRAEAALQNKQQFLESMLSHHESHRQLVAYEIHDTFLQDVIAALMYVDGYHEQRRSGSEPDLKALEMARKLLSKSIDEARRLISGLRPPIIDEQGIVAGIQYLINESRVRGIEVDFTNTMHTDRLDSQLEAAIFRIVQEALTNLERHSQSQYGQVEMTSDGKGLHLVVRDFGVGFDPTDVGEGHFGLQGMRERVRHHDGSMTIHSAPGHGTKIMVDIPLAATRADAH